MLDNNTGPTAQELEERLKLERETRAKLEAQFGIVYDTTELRTRFEVTSFCAPFVMVRDRTTNLRGSLEFRHDPRFYFNFIVDNG